MKALLNLFTYNSFIKANGYKHLVLFLCLIYCFMCACQSFGDLWSINLYNKIGQTVLVAIITGVLGTIIEVIEQDKADADWNLSDVLYCIVGGLIAQTLFNSFGSIEVLWVTFLVIAISLIGYQLGKMYKI